MRYIIEAEGILYGPIVTERLAANWALANCAVPWRLRSIHFVPTQDGGED